MVEESGVMGLYGEVECVAGRARSVVFGCTESDWHLIPIEEKLHDTTRPEADTEVKEYFIEQAFEPGDRTKNHSRRWISEANEPQKELQSEKGSGGRK
nr:hypothetical protein Iba_chr12fCG17500 [Ipomoea batatas]